jgi:hypothetical protein
MIPLRHRWRDADPHLAFLDAVLGKTRPPLAPGSNRFSVGFPAGIDADIAIGITV